VNHLGKKIEKEVTAEKKMAMTEENR